MKHTKFTGIFLRLWMICLGAAFYAFADPGRGSYVALTFTFVKKKEWQTKNVRITLDILVVVIGVILGGQAENREIRGTFPSKLCTVFLTLWKNGDIVHSYVKGFEREEYPFHPNEERGRSVQVLAGRGEGAFEPRQGRGQYLPPSPALRV